MVRWTGTGTPFTSELPLRPFKNGPGGWSKGIKVHVPVFECFIDVISRNLSMFADRQGSENTGMIEWPHRVIGRLFNAFFFQSPGFIEVK
jgi:hypothetical protein